MATAGIDGYGYVYDWAKCRVIINGMVVDNLIEVEATSTLQFGAGRFSLKVADPDRTIGDTLGISDETLIWMNLAQSANKVWGGYVESKAHTIESNCLMLNLTGREYSSRLLNQTFSDTFAGVELSTAVKDVIDTQQDDFDSNEVATTSGKTVSYSPVNETIYNGLKKMTDQFSYQFGINVEKHGFMYPKSTASTSPDTILWTDNVYQQDTLELNKEFLLNEVVVNSGVKTSGTISDTTSQDSYLLHSKVMNVSGLTTDAACAAYAAALVAQYKDPLTQLKVTTKFLPSTKVGDYIAVDIDILDLDGNYQVIELSHRYNRQDGLKTVATLGSKLTDSSIWLGEMEKRMKILEETNYG